jgi:hypothetical protein
MFDIVIRLRRGVAYLLGETHLDLGDTAYKIMEDAAIEIERLKAEVNSLRDLELQRKIWRDANPR